ncbi:hypothetical protein [Alicyclobacillus acidiphilus]|jgi:uncharacterized Zn finger protein|uniref:hypothetical protein n=1 Tax=Alicyclobacillus acidiphilus TaxID=182455 RepID=UPI00082B9C91|nr:hypothetical protein [Alicyclobacillus acidiphilus]
MKAGTRKRTLESLWKLVWKDIDKSRIRRAKQEAKAGAVAQLAVKEGEIQAVVRTGGPTRGSYHVSIPLLADYTAHRQEVVRWLTYCPRWIAAHFAGQWDEGFWTFIEENELAVFPNDTTLEKLQWGTKCTCSDWEPLCVHALTVLAEMVAQAEERPLRIFRFVGLEETDLLDGVHQMSADIYETVQSNWIRTIAEQKTPSDGETCDWMYEVEESTPSGRLVPQFRAGTSNS